MKVFISDSNSYEKLLEINNIIMAIHMTEGLMLSVGEFNAEYIAGQLKSIGFDPTITDETITYKGATDNILQIIIPMDNSYIISCCEDYISAT